MKVRFDGVGPRLIRSPSQDFDRTSKAFKLFYGITLTPIEHALRGWNWGKGELGKGELVFNVQNRPAFEIPYSEISNTNLAGRNEVTIDFSVPPGTEKAETNGKAGGSGKKAGMAKDQLMEMRFYIPGTVATKEKDEDGEEKSDAEEVEEQNAASLFYETLLEKAQIGDVAGDTYATFLDVLHLTPRWVKIFCSMRRRTVTKQRSLRRRYERGFLPASGQDLRLQNSIRTHQKIHAFAQARRSTYTHCGWS